MLLLWPSILMPKSRKHHHLSAFCASSRLVSICGDFAPGPRSLPGANRSLVMGGPQCLDGFMENPKKKAMRTRGAPRGLETSCGFWKIRWCAKNLGKKWWSFEHHRMDEDGLKMSQKNPQPTNQVGNPGIWGFLKMLDTVPKSQWPSWVSIGFNGHSWLGWFGVPAWLRESPFDDISRQKMEPF